MSIQIANATDLPEILRLQKECYLEEAEIYQDFSIPPLVQSLESIEKDFEDQVFLKSVISGKIVGSVRATIHNKTCEIGRLIVDKTARNQGLGKQLMKAIESHSDSVERYELFTGHLSSRNLSFYKKLGYKQFKTDSVNSKLKLVYLEKMNLLKGHS